MGGAELLFALRDESRTALIASFDAFCNINGTSKKRMPSPESFQKAARPEESVKTRKGSGSGLSSP